MFHDKCADKGTTVVVAKHGDNIFGGVADVGWVGGGAGGSANVRPPYRTAPLLCNGGNDRLCGPADEGRMAHFPHAHRPGLAPIATVPLTCIGVDTSFTKSRKMPRHRLIISGSRAVNLTHRIYLTFNFANSNSINSGSRDTEKVVTKFLKVSIFTIIRWVNCGRYFGGPYSVDMGLTPW